MHNHTSLSGKPTVISLLQYEQVSVLLVSVYRFCVEEPDALQAWRRHGQGRESYSHRIQPSSSPLRRRRARDTGFAKGALHLSHTGCRLSSQLCSPYLCMPRCMPFSTAPACPHRSSRRFKRLNDQLRAKRGLNCVNYQTNGNGLKRDKRALTSSNACQCRSDTEGAAEKLSKSCRRRKRRSNGRSRSTKRRAITSPSTLETDEQSDCTCSSSDSDTPLWRPGKSWDERRRNARVNGADIYVARVTKSGMGDAKPCWRCLEWCRWAGVKRVFHWNGEGRCFEVVKVNDANRENYETRADVRLFAGLVSRQVLRIRFTRNLIDDSASPFDYIALYHTIGMEIISVFT